jgi:hypothetical protein
MTKVKVLITVKTYPTLSSFRSEELVCTAGITEEGEWLRLYPIPFRKLNYGIQYRKYEWIEIDIEKNSKDFRKESYKPISLDDTIRSLGYVNTASNWYKRKKIVFKTQKYTNLKSLINEANNDKVRTSLALFKPSRIVDFVYKKDDLDWDRSTLECLSQGNLFEDSSHFKIIRKLPFKFSYVFEDDEGKPSTLMIEDWEVGALYWRIFDKTQSADEACRKVRYKYFEYFARTKDLYFFLGTNFIHHLKKSRNPFIIIGVFYP